ncbi:acyltransferase [Flavihumibacter rivuli]|uniref:acyltransferase family protein n=1 Tax=Flavihumibacter rivuli TaxID=2838156 RepID=UPI001BDF25A3|nr:acyltransferase [Flavihumibacter rivuli]ULQ56267.1 acyltransferase [Flavihumibacter rivuli]
MSSKKAFWVNLFRRTISAGAYFPEIDGLRFLAIGLVLVFHAYGYFLHYSPVASEGGEAAAPFLHALLRDFDKGVPLFFVLSGFILAVPFARHYFLDARPVSLSKFYIRRLTRLEPPYIISLLLLFTLQLAMHVYPFDQLFPSLMASLFYSHNVLLGPPLVSIVTWSLEIEVQFYILVPVFMLIYKLNPVARRSLLLAIALFLPLVREYAAMPVKSLYDYFEFFCCGILLADLYTNKTSVAGIMKNETLVGLAGLGLFLMVVLVDHDQELINRMLYPLLVGGFYLVVLLNQGWKKIFSFSPVALIGGMCYSIYLLHFAIISMAGRFTIHWQLGNGYIVNLVLQLFLLAIPVLVVSAVYYLLIEKPCMNPNWPSQLKAFLKRQQGKKYYA